MTKGSRSMKNKAKYEAYRSSGRRAKNKVIKLLKHFLKHPKDKQSNTILEKLK